MTIAPPTVRREPVGYQRAPHLRIIIGCGVAAVVLAVFAAVVNFATDQNPTTSNIPGVSSGLRVGTPVATR
jgi:hypothetical protein